MGERIVRTEIGQKIIQSIAEELQSNTNLLLSTNNNNNSILNNNNNDQEDNFKNNYSNEFLRSKIKNINQCRRIISTFNSSPKQNNNNNNNDTLLVPDTSIDILCTYKKQIQENCKDQSTFVKYFSEKKFSNPYIQSKILNIGKKLIPDNERKHHSSLSLNYNLNQSYYKNNNNNTDRNVYSLSDSIKQNESMNGSPSKNMSGSGYFKTQNSNSNSNNSIKNTLMNNNMNTTQQLIQQRLKNIKKLDNILLDQRSNRLVYLEQKIDQLNLRQTQYNEQRQNIHHMVQNKLNDIKSYVFQPPTLDSMKNLYGDPKDLMNYNEQYKKLREKQVIKYIHQKKYQEIWKKEEILKEINVKKNIDQFRLLQQQQNNQGILQNLNQQINNNNQGNVNESQTYYNKKNKHKSADYQNQLPRIK